MTRLVTAILLAVLAVACSPSGERVTATSNAPDERYLEEVRADPDISRVLAEDFTDEELMELGREACLMMDEYTDVERFMNDVIDAAFAVDYKPEEDAMDMLVVSFWAADTICPRNWPMFEQVTEFDT